VRGLIAALSLLAAGCRDLRDVFTPYSPNPADVRDVLAHPRPAPVLDVGLVLGCPADRDGKPSLCQRCRVKTAVRLWQKGTVHNLLFSGGAAHSPDVEADVMGDLAVQRGVPRERVLREPRALTTWQNLRFSVEIMRAHGLRTAFIVSTADHLARARRIARFYGLDDAHTAYMACDLDLPREDAPENQPPTNTKG
jgi:uncharacterized SAM-binding protein YcdF (DUF218 family)